MSHFFEPKDSERQIKSFAFKVLRRMKAAGDHTMQIEDVEGELWLAWVKACQSFNSQAGASFKTYLYRGMQLHINRWVEKHMERRIGEVHARSMDASRGDSRMTLADVIPSDDPAPGSGFMDDDIFEHAMKRLSPRARIFVRLLKDQPPELLEEVRALNRKAEYGQTIGIRSTLNHRVTSLMLFDLMEVPRPDRAQILKEVERVGDIMCRQVAL